MKVIDLTLANRLKRCTAYAKQCLQAIERLHQLLAQDRIAKRFRKKIIRAVRKTEERVGIKPRFPNGQTDPSFMHRWVAEEWGLQVAHNILTPQDVDEMTRDLESTDQFDKSPGAWVNKRGRAMVESRGGSWRTKRSGDNGGDA